MVLLAVVDGVIDWLWINAPQILITGSFIWGSVFVTIKVMNFNFRLERMELRFSRIEDQCGDLYRKVESIEIKLNLLITSVNKISAFLITSHGLSANIFESKSPIQLSSLGLKILNETGGKDYVDENLSALLDDIESNDPKSRLEVQSYSSFVITGRTSGKDFVNIMNYIYQYPVYKTDDGKSLNMDFGMVTEIMAVYLRNRYFEKHPILRLAV